MRASLRSSEMETHRTIGEIVETARRESALPNSEGKWQSVPKGQDQLKVVELEAKETDKALGKILKQIGI